MRFLSIRALAVLSLGCWGCTGDSESGTGETGAPSSADGEAGTGGGEGGSGEGGSGEDGASSGDEGGSSGSSSDDGAESTTTEGTTGDAAGYGKVFRLTTLELRDPHFFYDIPVLGCRDVSHEAAIPGVAPPLNDLIRDSMSKDENDDGFIDSSLVIAFDEDDPQMTEGVVSFGGAKCEFPAITAKCEPDAEPLTPTTQANSADTACFTPDPTVLTAAYQPAVTETPAECFTIGPLPIALPIGESEIELADSEISATYSAEDRLANGVVKGFVTETDAESAAFMVTGLGDIKLSELLPGSPDNRCGNSDDRDMHNGESGWWLHFAFEAREVDLSI